MYLCVDCSGYVVPFQFVDSRLLFKESFCELHLYVFYFTEYSTPRYYLVFFFGDFSNTYIGAHLTAFCSYHLLVIFKNVWLCLLSPLCLPCPLLGCPWFLFSFVLIRIESSLLKCSVFSFPSIADFCQSPFHFLLLTDYLFPIFLYFCFVVSFHHCDRFINFLKSCGKIYVT